jgi:hypothetical protein
VKAAERQSTDAKTAADGAIGPQFRPRSAIGTLVRGLQFPGLVAPAAGPDRRPDGRIGPGASTREVKA